MGNDLRKLVKALRAQGFIVERTAKNHWIVKNQAGNTVAIMASTPSDWRSWKNQLATLRRHGFRWPPKR
jgi:hypothetical protein